MGVVSKWLNRGGGMGNFIVIVGPPHTGKTTILCNIFKSAIENNFEIITTTNLFNPPPQIKIINSASKLLKAYAQCKGNVIIAIDDAQASFDSTSMASTKASKMNQTIYLFIAKIQGNFIIVAHYIEKIPKVIFDCGPMIIWAVKPGLMHIQGQVRSFQVAKSPYRFPKASIPSWRWDFNPNELWDELSKIKGKSNEEIMRKNKEKIIKFFDNGTHTGISKKKEIELVLKRFEDDIGKDVKFTQKYIADKFEVDPGYITRIKKTLN